MEAEYTSLRLAELVTKESASHFDFVTLCDMHYYIFQDIYEWAGKIRVINIEKSEPALGGIFKIFGRTLESTSVFEKGILVGSLHLFIGIDGNIEKVMWKK